MISDSKLTNGPSETYLPGRDFLDGLFDMLGTVTIVFATITFRVNGFVNVVD